MTITYTSLLGLTKPDTGTQSGTWGSDLNTGLTDYLDAAVAGAQVISGSQTAVTLSVTTGTSGAPSALSQAGSGATGSSQYQIIRCTGNPAGLLTITAPASDKTYVILNATSTSQAVKIVGAGPTTGVTIVSGERAFVAWNGSDFVKVGGAAGGSNTQVQYNNNGVFGGVSGATTNGTAITFSTTNLKLQGSSTGVSSFASANSSASDYTYTFPAASTTIPVATQTLTFSGPTAARTITLPDANFTAARTDAAQTFTGVQTFSSNPVLSGGTANGVLYLNGSSAATSGSALTFDGAKLNNSSGSAAGIIQSTDTAGSGNFVRILGDTTAGSLINFSTGSSLRFATSADNFGSFSELMRLTSTGLGIGTSSPSQRLHVTGSSGATTVGTAATIQITSSTGLSAPAGDVYLQAVIDSATAGDRGTALAFFTGRTAGIAERARIDSLGNLGLGVTPSAAWSGIFKAFQINAQGALMATSASMQMGNNVYYDGDYKFIGTGYAQRYYQASGQHVWTVSTVSGSANGTITETQAMTLDASGNLGVGTTSPSSILDVQKAGTAAATTDLLELTNSGNAASMTNTGTGILFNQFYYDATTPAVADAGRIAVKTEGNWTSTASTQDAYMTFETALDGTVAERARITSGGQFFLGSTSTPNSGSVKMSVVGGSSGGAASALQITYNGGTFGGGLIGALEQGGGLQFYTFTNNVGSESYTERARITSGGNLLVGTTVDGQKLTVAGNQRFTGSQVGTKIENQHTLVSVSTATTILDDAGSLGRFVIVNGESSGNRFCDLVLCSTSVSPTVVASFTALGSPAARTYTRSGSALQLAMASGTYTVAALALGY